MGSVPQVRIEPRATESVSTQTSLLSVRDLRVTYVKEKGLFLKRKYLIKALDGVSLDIFPSESVAMVGETGSGKTTLARCIMGLTKPNEGRILFEGSDASRLKGKKLRAHMRRVQIIYQDPYESLNPMKDIFTIVSTPIKFLAGEKDRTAIHDKVSQILMDVGLDPNDVMHRYPHQLSGGQRQRVNIARALAPEPELLIADEPITMLDAEQRINILSLLRSLKDKRKLTVLMITHDLASARLMSDRIYVMYMGKIVESGPAKQIISSPRHPYVDLIRTSAPRIKSSKDALTSTSLDEIPPMDENVYPSKGCVFHPRCKYATQECRDFEPKLTESELGHSFACYHPVNS
jgi:oligopeptide/dipeptide ABC transporter ATP-binding protein